jgi:MFS family permease
MALPILTWISALFMIGRNIPSLFFKIRDLINKEKRAQWTETPTKLFTLIILITTACAGLICGISLLFPNLIFGYYMFIVVSGMMIYSYFVYVGNCFEEEKWFMFSLCIFVIMFTSILVALISYNLAIGFFD